MPLYVTLEARLTRHLIYISRKFPLFSVEVLFHGNQKHHDNTYQAKKSKSLNLVSYPTW